MKFVPKHFLRCHSKTDNDSADVSTQVWQAVFEPSSTSYLVATCGGNKVNVINVVTGTVEFRYSITNGILYTLSWCTACPENNILATAGTNNTIIFIDLSTETAYLHYIVLKDKRKNFISSILFHPYKNILFCALNDGRLYVFKLIVDNKRIVELKEKFIIDLECEIFGLTFCKENDCLLIATNNGLFGWNNSQRQDQKLIVFELPENPKDLYKEQNEKVIDSVEVVENSWIATKVALHGVIYIFNLDETLSKINANKCVVKPPFVLQWSNTDNYFMSCGVGLDGKLLACGDDEGNVWIYNLKKIDFTSSNNDTKVIEAQNILKWPKLQDKYLKRTKKLEVDVYGIVIAKCAIHANGKYLVTVTDNNFVCLYSS